MAIFIISAVRIPNSIRLDKFRKPVIQNTGNLLNFCLPDNEFWKTLNRRGERPGRLFFPF
jgi:hypothetical protein